MKIKFKGPSFWALEDETKFFEWIYSLPNYKEIAGHGLNLVVELSEPVEQSTIHKLFILFKRWELDF